jgi:hypothetical protein
MIMQKGHHQSLQLPAEIARQQRSAVPGASRAPRQLHVPACITCCAILSRLLLVLHVLTGPVGLPTCHGWSLDARHPVSNSVELAKRELQADD